MNTVRRVGLVDICAAVVVAFVIFLSAPTPEVIGAHSRLTVQDARFGTPEQLASLSHYQAQLVADPGNGEVVEQLSTLLVLLKEYDHALRVAGDASKIESPTRWRSLWAISFTHADRLEIPQAHDYAQQALAACDSEGAICPERPRLALYEQELQRGLDAIARGMDPAADPRAFRAAIMRSNPIATFRGN